jgi:hypothetical protein
MDDIERIGNLIEAGLWLMFAVILAGKSWRAQGRLRRVFVRLAVAFLVFSVSDVIESRTGAWWRPPWLLVIKIACVTVFWFGLREYYRIRKKSDL